MRLIQRMFDSALTRAREGAIFVRSSAALGYEHRESIPDRSMPDGLFRRARVPRVQEGLVGQRRWTQCLYARPGFCCTGSVVWFQLLVDFQLVLS
jgi:hypothetical protein